MLILITPHKNTYSDSEADKYKYTTKIVLKSYAEDQQQLERGSAIEFYMI